MRKLLVALVLIGGMACADSVRYRGNTVQIMFDEPVVPQSACENKWRDAASPADKGLDLFDVTGDDQHRPLARWEDQDRLVIEFSRGTSCGTEYRLSFRPGCGKYLSHEPMPQTSFTFKRPRTTLVADTVPGLDAGSAVVFPRGDNTREEQTFSAESGVGFVYREILMSDYTDKDGVQRTKRQFGASMPATVQPAKLKHVAETDVLDRLAKNTTDWAALTPESPMPHAVLVQPQSPLPEGTDWELRYSDSVGFIADSVASTHKVAHGLSTHAEADYDSATRGLHVTLSFAAPLTTEEAGRAWKDLELSIGDAKAEAGADPKVKTLTHQGKEYRFRLQEIVPPDEQTLDLCRDKDSADAPKPRAYRPQGVAVGLRFTVEGETPVVMDLVVPQGLTTALGGRQTPCPQRHRLSLNPAYPELACALPPYIAQRRDCPLRTALLPWKGEHKLRLSLANTDVLQATAYRVPGEILATRTDAVQEALQHTRVSEQILDLQLRLERHQRGIKQMNPEELVQVKHQLKRLDSQRKSHAKPALLRELTPLPTQDVPLPQGDNSNLSTTEAVLDMDAVLGGEAKPGVYLLRLDSQAAPAVRQTLADLNLPQDLLDTEQYALVQLTDLNAALDYEALMVFAYHLSDGSPVTDAKVTPYIAVEKKRLFRDSLTTMARQGEARPMPNGCIAMEQLIGLGYGKFCVLIESGDDYMVVGHGSSIWEKGGPEEMCVAKLQTDRELYRPGETVHVRGILRCVSHPQGVATLPKDVGNVRFRVRKPDGKDLVDKQVALDASGGIDESFELPQGEEDVTGEYCIEISSQNIQTPSSARFNAKAYVQVEVFRRDSFKISSQLTVDRVAPREFTFALEAIDLNGTPVSDGKAQLGIGCPVPFTLSTDNGTAPKTELKREFPLDAQGKVEIKGRFAAFGPKDFASLHISGSVSNDREEHLQMGGQSAYLAPADFFPDFDISSGRLTLKSAIAGNKALDREQRVHVALHYEVQEIKELPNGFVFVSTKPAILKEEDVVVPADCREGVPWDARAFWLDYADTHPETIGSGVAHLMVSGTDTQGRSVEKEEDIYASRRSWEDIATVDSSGLDSCTWGDDGKLHIKTHFQRDGTACLVVDIGRPLRTQLLPVRKGKQEITFPLAPGEEGTAVVTIYLPHPDAKGVFSKNEVHSGRCEVPFTLHTLQTQLDVPEHPVRPGSKIRLGGQVCKDGQGVPATVTLFAVDEGMLSLSSFQVCDLVSSFYGHSWCYRNMKTLVQGDMPTRPQDMSYSMLPGLWGTQTETPAYHRARRLMKNVAFAGREMTAGITAYDDCDDDDDMADCAPASTVLRYIAWAEAVEEDEDEGSFGFMKAPEKGHGPRLRDNFHPLALWQGALKTDAQGRFSAEVELPDTLTTYQVYAMVLGDDGSTFGNAEAKFTVNQPLMLTLGTPLFMSTGDTLRLPLTVTNNTDADGTWTIALSSADESQKVSIKAHQSATVYFDVTAQAEGDCTLDWTARDDTESDAVRGTFPVRFPAPLLKEVHHVVLAPGQEQQVARLLSPELADSTRGETELLLSANPLLHLIGNMDYLLEYPYGCTEQTASGLLPWLFYDRMAPLSPLLAETPAAEVRQVIARTVETLFKRQLKDGGLAYWPGQDESSGWASAHAALVFTIAQEQGHGDAIPADKMQALVRYLHGYLAELKKDGKRWDADSPMTLFALGRVLGEKQLIDKALAIAEHRNAEDTAHGCFQHRDIAADLALIRALRQSSDMKHEDFLAWMRARGHDYRHTTTLRSGWMLIALHEHLRLTPESTTEATARLQDGTVLTLNQGVTILKPQAKPLSALPTSLLATEGTVYATFKVKARPECTEYPGVVEKGLQITRIYEKKGEDGVWREAKDFRTGDLVRVTLTCAKSAHGLEYFVLEDYLPSCMEAINPNVPSQAAGLDFPSWSRWFDHKEYLADRVRGFCTRWGGRDLLNMSYFARVKRAGSSTAPPAQAQLMYEPQTYGLSPNTKVQSK